MKKRPAVPVSPEVKATPEYKLYRAFNNKQAKKCRDNKRKAKEERLARLEYLRQRNKELHNEYMYYLLLFDKLYNMYNN